MVYIYIDECTKRVYIPEMKWKPYYRSLKTKEKDAYALRAKTTRPYIEIHLIPNRKIPREDLMNRLVLASDGNCTKSDVLDHFYSKMFYTENPT